MPEWLPLYVESRDRLAALARDLDETRASTAVPACPGWDVHGVVSHLTGILDDISTGRLDDVGTPAWTESQVASRRDRPIRDVVEEWDALMGFAQATIPAMGEHGGTLASDVLSHEIDVCAALGVEPPVGTPAFEAAVDRHVGLLADRLVAAGLGPVGILAGGRSWVVGDGQPVASVRVDAFELLRGLTGRRTRAQVADWDWDSMGDDYAAAWSAYGTPAEELDEPTRPGA
jgi:uncharacterized protein (TIGR03083 family)